MNNYFISVFLAVIFYPYFTMSAFKNIQNLYFEEITAQQGLSQNTINCIYQDSQGFLWIGTQDGLNRYDGYQFEIFKHNPRDSNTISHNWIWDIYEDASKNLWIATWEGLNRYDPVRSSFLKYLPDKNRSASISNSRPTSITEDKAGNLWIGTWGGGLNLYDRENDCFTSFLNNPEDSSSICHNFIRTLYIDQQGLLWIGTWDGLCFADPVHIQDLSNLKFTSFRHNPKDHTSLSGNKIFVIYEDNQQNFWIGTFTNGLNRLDRSSKKFIRFQFNPHQSNSISSNNISSIYQDSAGNLWVATHDAGLNLFLPDHGIFQHFNPASNVSTTLNSSNITTLYEDKAGILWIGTYNSGLNRLNLYQKKFSLTQHSEKDPASLNDNLVRCFYQDRQGYLWIGTEQKGLNRYDPRTGSYRHFRHDPTNSNSLSSDNIQSITAGDDDVLWIATFGGGLNRYHPQTNQIQHFRYNAQTQQSISSDEIEIIYLDRQGSLWIGTSDAGLDRYIIDTGEFQHYKFNPKDSLSISSNYILSIFQDSWGRLWIGGWGGGLNQFDYETNKFKRYIHDPQDPESICDNIINSIYESMVNGKPVLWLGTAGGLSYASLNDSGLLKFTHKFESDGLPNQHIYGILEDNAGNLWLSTNQGLSRFSPYDIFKNYDTSDGLLIQEFSGGAYYKSRAGQFYFGSSHGFITFMPDSIKDNQYIPPIVVTSFKKFNKEVKMDRHISTLQDITLSYDDYVFSFDFSALDFTAPLKNQYAYKMEGFNEDWIYTEASRRFATFTNMNPGKYIFRVKGSNSDGIWNEAGVSIKVTIFPPFWKTWWFRNLAVLLILLLVITTHYYRVRHLKRDKKAQEQVSAKLIYSQERERKRIASELHDSLGQNLLIINNVVQHMKLRHSELSDDFTPLSQSIQETINEVREISHNLHPHVLDRLGLKKAIESVINKAASASDIHFHSLIADINHALPAGLEIHLFRIIQEAINNILKHSEAKTAAIEIKKSDHQIDLSIIDDGKGFLVRELKKGIVPAEGMGISDMEERTRLLNGKLTITSKISNGTNVKLIIPY